MTGNIKNIIKVVALSYFSILIVCLLYSCTSKPPKSNFPGIEIETDKFHPQFISIVDEYISYHPDYDSYLIASSYELGHELNRDNIKNTHYFIMPSTRSYVIELSPDKSSTYFFNEYDDLSFYIKVGDKAVYIKSDLDLLSARLLRHDSIPTQQIVTNKTGGEIWCFTRTHKNNFRIISKDAENGWWPGIIIDKIPSTLKLTPPSK